VAVGRVMLADGADGWLVGLRLELALRSHFYKLRWPSPPTNTAIAFQSFGATR
jgi:hypothetical protein